MQLDLSLWPRNCVRSILADYVIMKAESLASETVDDDYRWRTAWLVEVLGEATPAEAVTFSVLEDAARSARGVVRDVTIKRRLVFWRAAVKYAAMREVVPRGCVPELPPWLRDDSVRCTDYYTTVQFAAFRLALQEPYRRWADLGMWMGGPHTYDLIRTARMNLEPDYEWAGAGGEVVAVGRYLRRNHKNRRCVPCWVPMEPELRELALEWLREPGAPDRLIVGHLNNVRRAFHAAAARADLPPIRPDLGLRASHATMLMARDYPYEYVRIVLGHQGEVSTAARPDGSLAAVTDKHPTILTTHYLRPSPELLVGKKARGG